MMLNHSLKPNKIDGIDSDTIMRLAKMEQPELMRVRHEIDVLLGTRIKDLNLSEELGVLFMQGKKLLDDVMKDNLTPANQKAQVFNTVKGQIDKLVALRQQVFSQERMKRFEAALLKCVEMQGQEQTKVEFLELYGSYLEDKGQ